MRNDYKLIPLTKGYWAKVDPEDWPELMLWSWSTMKPGPNCVYACRNDRGTKITLHRYLTKAPVGTIVDHKNHDTLDNRKDNLRITTKKGNSTNRPKQRSAHTSKYKGVHWAHEKWNCKITNEGKDIWLGRFDNELDAALAYDTKARQLWGDLAYTNFGNEHAN